MRIITWNCRRANAKSDLWQVFAELEADIALLQEVSGIPAPVDEKYTVTFKRARGKTGAEQKFGTAVLARSGYSISPWALSSDKAWVNRELEHFAGNIVSLRVSRGSWECVVVCIYNPAWNIPPARLQGVEPGDVRLPQQSSKLWLADLLWDALRQTRPPENTSVVVGGDFNTSPTFDTPTPRGNREYLDRLLSLGLSECLAGFAGQTVPTFKNPSNGKVIHQIDHLFVSPDMASRLLSCRVGDYESVFGASLSDHVPVVADFSTGVH